MQLPDDLIERARKVRLVAMDVDGVLTDGSISLGDRGEIKTFYVRDGLAVSVARHSGLAFAFITGRQSAITSYRANELKIDYVVQACHGKADALRQLCEKAGLSLEETAFIGDDWNDVPAIRIAGLSAAPGDAAKEIRGMVHLVTSANGGRGAVRELLEMILEAQGGWAAACERWVESLSAGVEAPRQ